MKTKAKQDLTKHGGVPMEGTQESVHTPSWGWDIWLCLGALRVRCWIPHQYRWSSHFSRSDTRLSLGEKWSGERVWVESLKAVSETRVWGKLTWRLIQGSSNRKRRREALKGSQLIQDVLWDFIQWTPRRTSRAMPLKSMLPMEVKEPDLSPSVPTSLWFPAGYGYLTSCRTLQRIMDSSDHETIDSTVEGTNTKRWWSGHCYDLEKLSYRWTKHSGLGRSCMLVWLCCLGSRGPSMIIWAGAVRWGKHLWLELEVVLAE